MSRAAGARIVSGLANPRDQSGRGDEGRGVGRRSRSAPSSSAHQRTAERRSGDFRDRVDRFALAVGIEQALARHEVGDEDVVGEIEEHGANAGDGGDRVEDGQRQHVAHAPRSGMASSAAARIRSVAISSGRRRCRSTQPPANHATSTPGSDSATASEAQLVGGRVDDAGWPPSAAPCA